jgi:hypothetical protein
MNWRIRADGTMPKGKAFLRIMGIFHASEILSDRICRAPDDGGLHRFSFPLEKRGGSHCGL